MSVEETASDYIIRESKKDQDFAKNIELLDLYDFSEFLSDGRSLQNIRDAIEEKYDKEFWDKYRMYVFDSLTDDDICEYLTSRYDVWFSPYTDWVVRHEYGAYEKARRRTEDRPRKMAQ